MIYGDFSAISEMTEVFPAGTYIYLGLFGTTVEFFKILFIYTFHI